MDGPGFSERERTILDGIERDLAGEDALLDRRMRTMRRGLRPWAVPWRGARRHPLRLAAPLLLTASATLFVLAVAAERPALIWAFAAVWLVTLACLLRMLIGWCRRWAATMARREPRGPAEGQGTASDGPGI
ncbi:DUF3040 domain-containing protein [Streptomyces sp. NPDC101118]|uniref:DUF3040 domain-containing protein n=1 Tax=Streptomyces sp. NPDC101118 TaxID=3366109 RepID=UPI0038020704